VSVINIAPATDTVVTSLPPLEHLRIVAVSNLQLVDPASLFSRATDLRWLQFDVNTRIAAALLVRCASTAASNMRVLCLGELIDLDTQHSLQVAQYLGCIKMPQLRWLTLHFSKLTRLPDKLAQLQRLKLLDLAGCASLEQLPEQLCSLQQLKHLDLSGCCSLRELPESVGSLKLLQYADLSGCVKLRSLPQSTSGLTQLSWLDMQSCAVIQLLESMGQMQQLRKLRLDSSSLEQLPDSIGQLQQLQDLSLRCCCCCLESLPASFGQLPLGPRLDLSWCGSCSSCRHPLAACSTCRNWTWQTADRWKHCQRRSVSCSS
jgi:Leucine-rich repeat (LRR) protein